MSTPDKDAIEIGSRQAEEAYEYRSQQIHPMGLAPPGAGTLLAEGDSWFDYPWHDVLSELEDNHGFDVDSVSHRGDRIEDMAYNTGQLVPLVRKLEKMIRSNKTPKAILISGGGNDVAGESFAALLNHAKSGSPGLNQQVVSGFLDVRIRSAYITILSAVTEITNRQLGYSVPILLHGYDYAVADGRGYLGGWGPLPGPWLEPGFREKGYEDPHQRQQIVTQLIDRLNEMLASLGNVNGLGHVRHLDLRGTLKNDNTYTDWWDNELHPTKRGYRAIAAKYAEALSSLPLI